MYVTHTASMYTEVAGSFCGPPYEQCMSENCCPNPEINARCLSNQSQYVRKTCAGAAAATKPKRRSLPGTTITETTPKLAFQSQGTAAIVNAIRARPKPGRGAKRTNFSVSCVCVFRAYVGQRRSAEDNDTTAYTKWTALNNCDDGASCTRSWCFFLYVNRVGER